MTSHTLTIRFAGICTHFRFGVVAGVPHRVALPNAAFFRTGTVTVRQTPEVIPSPLFYYLMPHYAQLEVPGGPSEQLQVPALVNDGGPVMQHGDILSGIRLQILNAVDPDVLYVDDKTPKLTDFVPSYSYSGDVVAGGRAICFFDLYGGKVCSMKAPGGAVQTIVKVETEGPPVLLVTPLGNSDAPPHSYRLPLYVSPDTTETTLIVKNLEEAREAHAHADQQGGAFDFLFHYLTERGGIPQVINMPTPGMRPEKLQSASPEDLADALKTLASLALQPGEKVARRVLLHPDEVTPSCSNSQYP